MEKKETNYPFLKSLSPLQWKGNKLLFFLLLFLIMIGYKHAKGQDTLACFPPSSHLVVGNHSQSPTVFWEDMGAEQYLVRYRRINELNWTIKVANDTALRLLLPDENVLFIFEIATICDSVFCDSIACISDTSDWTLSDTIDPRPRCKPLEGIQFVAYDTRINIEWNYLDLAVHYELRWRINDSTATWQDTILPNYRVGCTILNLLPNTNYVFQLRAVCETFTLNWPPEVPFHTLSNTGIAHTLITKMQFFPNPGQNVLYITKNIRENISIACINSLGKVVNLIHIQANEMYKTIDTSKLPTGIYLLYVQSTDQEDYFRWVKSE